MWRCEKKTRIFKYKGKYNIAGGVQKRPVDVSIGDEVPELLRWSTGGRVTPAVEAAGRPCGGTAGFTKRSCDILMSDVRGIPVDRP